MSLTFDAPPFFPHRWLRSGHLQTVWQLRSHDVPFPSTTPHRVELVDGDSVMLHDDIPTAWQDDGLSVLLIHGLCGCHASPYMQRFAAALGAIGIRTFRMDMRGCGHAFDLASNVTHAGRSEDVLASLAMIAQLTPQSKLAAVGISLGGNQLLRAVGRVGAGHDDPPGWWHRMQFAVAISAPIDLRRCSERMQQLRLRPYNRHFIRHLLDRVPPAVRARVEFQTAIARRRPRTLWEFDDAITAPLSGFLKAEDYYRECSAAPLLDSNPLPTLLLAAADDPIVPIASFRELADKLPPSTTLLCPPRGGHVGFINSDGGSWMDDVLLAWIEHVERITVAASA